MIANAALLLTLAVAQPGLDVTPISRRQLPGMTAFGSRAELRAFLTRVMEERARRAARWRSVAAPSAAAAVAQGVGEADAITNVQHAGVDEGGIVKLRGNHLVVLRRGRLFTIAIGGSSLRPVSAVDAFGPDIDPRGTWYDEMLISGDRVVVIGYSYSRGGTEVGIFRLGDDGSLRYETTFQLRSNDYYSSRNYASRLIGSRLVFYAPLYLPWSITDVDQVLPAMQRWDTAERGFRVIVRPERVFRPAGFEPDEEVALHTVTSCDLARPHISCEASVVVGPPGRVFYVSPGSVYVWATSWQRGSEQSRPASLLTRIPLAGEAVPTALRVAGSPVDQFSFHESEDGHLNVLTRSEGRGEAMWNSEWSEGRAALLRLPLVRMGDGSASAPASWYRPLEMPSGWVLHNRFVGEWLLYGAGNGWSPQRQTDTTLFAVRWRGGAATRLALSHGIDRIEVMGGDAVVIGARGNNLEFSGISLAGAPVVRQRFVMPQASQGELRSHGFFYRSDGEDAGVLGLPVREQRLPGYRHLIEGSASIVFLRNTGRRFTELGLLVAGAVRNVNDNCRASCVDWYGNARPIFARGRIFALLGYELVEGVIAEGELRELQRVNFAAPLLASR
ncbi:MAG TPA: beta-propeller domain-containing protein [Gemmatimonadales bacterium]|nr:beta-propeller domain-containing protein [Gemmatimonadales bacterium]